MKQNSFSRFKALMSMVSVLMVKNSLTRNAAIELAGGYKSRGKGKGRGKMCIQNYDRSRSKYTPHYGAKESAKFCARNKQ